MRKTLALPVMCLVIVLLAGSNAGAGVEFRLMGGMDYIAYDHFNNFADNLNDDLANLGVSEEIGNIHWVPEINGEVKISLLPLLSTGFSAGYIYGKSDFSLEEGSTSLSLDHNIKVYPLMLTGYVNPPIPFAEPYLYAGAGLYMARMEFDQSFSEGGDSYGYTAELEKTGFGLHGGAGMKFSFTPLIGLEVGVRGRWADIKGFEGTAEDSEGEKEDVILVYQEEDDGDVVFGPESKDNPDNYGEGSLDLSGFGFYVGLSVGF